jgi:hypothetical protein
MGRQVGPCAVYLCVVCVCAPVCTCDGVFVSCDGVFVCVPVRVTRDNVKCVIHLRLAPIGRCNAQQFTLVAAGRWASCSASFMVYFRQGLFMKQDHIAVGGDKSSDPVWDFWVWESTIGEFV